MTSVWRRVFRGGDGGCGGHHFDGDYEQCDVVKAEYVSQVKYDGEWIDADRVDSAEMLALVLGSDRDVARVKRKYVDVCQHDGCDETDTVWKTVAEVEI